MEIRSPLAEHTHTIIPLHGRDSTAKEFADEFFESQGSGGETLLELFPTARWVFPTAELLKSKRFGCQMSQWFDMYSTEDPHDQENDQNLLPAIGRIREVVNQEAALVGRENIILGGISQGCAAAIHALLDGQMRLGGFIGLCSWLPRREATKSINRLTNHAVSTPLLICHAQDDDTIHVSFGKKLRDGLEGIGMQPRWREYATGGHWINEPQGVDDIANFLKDANVP